METTDTIVKNSISELKLSLFATALVLGIALTIYTFLPNIRAYFSEKDSALVHGRTYEPAQQGGRIIYELNPETDSDEKASRMDGLKQDLSILSRRFQRGQFELLSIQGSMDAKEVINMKIHKNSFMYTISSEGDSVILEIKAQNAASQKALHEYLAFMKERWKPEK